MYLWTVTLQWTEQLSNSVRCFYLLGAPNSVHSTNYLSVRHKYGCSVVILCLRLFWRTWWSQTNLLAGRGPLHELSVIGEESCEPVALCVSRLLAGKAETPSGRHNMAIGTWCVKQAFHSWIIHRRMSRHEIGRPGTTVEQDEVKKARKEMKELRLGSSHSN